MSRPISGKVLVEATLTAVTPLSVGGAGAGGDVDLALAVDGRGRLYVPGSSLAGPIRAWIESSLDKGGPLAEALFGYQEGDKGHASWLFVEDAPVTLPTGLVQEIRHGIQIGRATGTAREKFFFTRAILPRGSTLELKLELDLPVGDVTSQNGSNKYSALDFEMAVRLFLEDLKENGMRLGAAKTRGLGRLQLQNEKHLGISRFDFAGSPGGLIGWLRNGQADVKLEDLGDRHAASGTRKSPVARCGDCDYLEIEIEWQPLSPVMVKSGFDGIYVDTLPLVSGIDGMVAPVIPGSSLKGVFRSHAARIVRTVAANPAMTAAAAAAGANPDPDGGIAVIADLFGDSDRAGRLSVDDVYQKNNKVDAVEWRSEDQTAMDGATTWEDHVAIDRFTGGAAENRLYNLRAPRPDKGWDEIRIRVDFGRPVCPEDKDARSAPVWPVLTPEEKKVQAALVFLLLRDLEAGLVPFGFGTKRGMGDIRVEKVTVKGRVAGEAIDIETAPPLLSKVEKAIIQSLSNAWKDALEASPPFAINGAATP